MKINVDKIKDAIIPIGIGIAAAITALCEEKRKRKVEELICKVDKMEND